MTWPGRAEIEAREHAERQRTCAWIELERCSVAVHEAGHATIGTLNGLSLVDVSVRTMASGLCRWSGAAHGLPLAYSAMAGDLAASRLGWAIGHDHRSVGTDGDREQIVECLAGFTEREITALHHVVRAEVSEHWDAICAVALELVAERTLSGAQVNAIIAGAVAGAASRFEERCRELAQKGE